MDDWLPEQQTEWTTRFANAQPGSQEKKALEEMQWTGIFVPTVGGGPPDLKPPVHPPVADPLADAKMNAFFKERRRLTPEEEKTISGSIAEKASMGIANTQTRKNVPLLKGGKTRKAKKGGEIVTTFFNIRDQVKLYHWQTKSFAEHKATDDLVGTLDTNIDKFVESYMGRYGRPYVKRTLPVKNLTVTGIRAFITKSDEWLTNKLPRMLKKTDSDLLNIRDEILADLNQVKYLFTLS